MDKTDKKGKLIIFSAPSGSGKTTLVHYLLEQPELNLAFSISATSRNKRKEEEHAKDYYFLPPEEFKKKIKENAFIEWEEVYTDNFYGTLKSEVERLIKEGKNVIFDIDVKGGMNIKNQFPENSLSVFVMPPSIEELEKRLRNRQTESDEKIKMRVNKAAEELNYASQFDVVLPNHNLEKAKEEAYGIVSEFLKK